MILILFNTHIISCILLYLLLHHYPQDMADLAMTSKISVLFQVTMVLVVVIFSPVSESIKDNGGIKQIASNSIIKMDSIFIGLGILSFAYGK